MAIGAGALLFVLWFTHSDLSLPQVVAIIERFDPTPILPVGLLLVLHLLIGAEKWRLVEQRLTGNKPALGRSFGAAAAATAIGQFLPSPLANAVTRGASNRVHEGKGFRRGLLSSIWEQAFDIYVALALSVAAAVAIGVDKPGWFAPSAVLAAAAAALPLLLLTPLSKLHYFRRPAPRVDTQLLCTELSLKLFGLSILRFGTLALITIAVAAAANTAISPIQLVIAVPLVTAATAISMIPGGLGATEWSFTAVLSAQGVGHEAVLAFVLANRLILTGAALVVGFVGALTQWPRLRLRETAFARIS